MQTDSAGSDALPLNEWPRLLDRLACPVCHGALRIEAPGAILCTACLRRYPVLDGIPVLIPARAIGPAAPADQRP